MKYQKPINTVQNNDEFSSGLMEAYGSWMGGTCFQNTDPVELNLSEAPFDGMDPQSHGAEIEDTTKRKKEPKKGAYVGQESAPKNEEVLEREEYELDGITYVIEKVKGLDGKACWKGYKYAGTKMKGGKKVDDCVKAGFEPEGDDLQEKAPPGEKYERMVKHIKKGYSKGGVSEKEKSIAYATAWKAKNKGMKEESDYDEKEDDDKMCGKCKKSPCKCDKEMKKEGYDVETAEALWAVVGEALTELGEMDGAKFKVIGEKMDPVGKEDGDIDNDGDKDKSDKYLHARRKKIGKILAMKKK
jgi:hypothetical protein